MIEFDKYLSRLVQCYTGKQLAIVCAGGGVSLSRLVQIPGSSKVLHDISILYSEDATVFYIEREGWESPSRKMVSREIAEDLYNATANRLGDSCCIVAITSSLTTNRPRKGDNQAYIHIGETAWHLKLDKLHESVYSDSVIPWRDQQIAVKRESEDRFVAEVALRLATGFDEEESLERLATNGTLRQLPEAT